MPDYTYVVVDPEGGHHQAYESRYDPELGRNTGRGYYSDPTPARRLDRTLFRMFANPKNWKQQQRRPSEPGIDGSRMFELCWDGESLTITGEIK